MSVPLATHEKYMRRCIELARNAAGYTAPNPMVGCVIVCDGEIIGEGYHRKYGEPHAEVNAMRSVKKKELLSRSTLYVNLEPCSHYGKTPPCSDLIIAHHIPDIVTGSFDPNPLVAGKGIERLRTAGCRVTENVLKEDSDRLNIRFMTYHLKKRPFVLLKWARTTDGFIDVIRNEYATGRPTWITKGFERTLAHKWRSEESAIMVGTNTAFLDNPMLNLRQWKGHMPLRIVIDRKLRLPSSLHLFDGSQPTLVFTEKKTENTSYAEYAAISFDQRLPYHILDELYRRNMTSVLIEGGTRLLQTFINEGLWDEARIFTGKTNFGNGIKAPEIHAIYDEVHCFRDSKLEVIRNTSI